MLYPSAFAAAAEAFQVCHSAEYGYYNEVQAVSIAITEHLDWLGSDTSRLRFPAALPALVASSSLQQYAMDALAAAAAVGLSYAPPFGRVEDDSTRVATFMEPFKRLLHTATVEGSLSDERMSALIVNEAILAPLRSTAEGGGDNGNAKMSSRVLGAVWFHYSLQGRMRGGSFEVLCAAQGTMLAALGQAAAVLQLAAVPPAQQRRAVRQALEAKIVKVPISINGRFQHMANTVAFS